MPGRSWMAALTLAAGLAAPAVGDDRNPIVPVTPRSSTSPPSNPADTPEPATQAPLAPATAGPKTPGDSRRLKLELRIAGLTSQGCDVEIKPSHAGCAFRSLTKHVDMKGWLDVVLDDVQSRNADRDCTFAITIKETGQPVRTTHRVLQLKPPGAANAQTMTVYLSSPSKLARAAQAETIKR